jgi:hypothetical protein
VTFGGDKLIVPIDSRDNGLIKQLRRLAEQSTAYRKLGRFWIEGDHLCRAALERKLKPAVAVLAQSFVSSAATGWAQAATRTVVVPDALFEAISGLESSARVGFLLDLPAKSSPRQGLASVVLDRVQDAGNVGSILRSAAPVAARLSPLDIMSGCPKTAAPSDFTSQIPLEKQLSEMASSGCLGAPVTDSENPRAIVSQGKSPSSHTGARGRHGLSR